METLTIEQMARVCHEAYRGYCEAVGDFSQKTWIGVDHRQRVNAINGTAFVLLNPGAVASTRHEAWMRDKLRDGWAHGRVEDIEEKEHPDLLPFEELPLTQQRKDALFVAIVNALK